jgi:DNA-binding FadR family transcriptional regulator
VLEALAARPANDDARAAVARATVAFAEVVDRHHRGEADDNDVAAADVNVLGAVVAATGRPVLRLALNPVVAVLRGLPALRRAIVADAADSVAAYVALQAWLAAPDARAIPALAALLAARDARTLERLAARSPDDDDDDDNDNDNDDDNDRARRATAPRGGRR